MTEFINDDEIITYEDVSRLVQKVQARTWALVENGPPQEIEVFLNNLAQTITADIGDIVMDKDERDNLIWDIYSKRLIDNTLFPVLRVMDPNPQLLEPLLETISEEEQITLREEITSTAVDQLNLMIIKGKPDKALRLRETYIAWGFITSENEEILSTRSTTKLGNYINRLIRNREVDVLAGLGIDLYSRDLIALLGSKGINLLRFNTYATVDVTVTQNLYDNRFSEARAIVDNCLAKGLINLKAYETLLAKLPDTYIDRTLISIMNYVANVSGDEALLLPIQYRLNELYRFITEEQIRSGEEILEHTLSLLEPGISFEGRDTIIKNLDIMETLAQGLSEKEKTALSTNIKRLYFRLIGDLAIKGEIDAISRLVFVCKKWKDLDLQK